MRKICLVFILAVTSILFISSISFAAPSASVVDSYARPGYSNGLAWDGTYLWSNDYDNTMIYKLDISNPSTGNEVGSFSAPTGGHDLAWDGSYLWIDGVNKYNESTGYLEDDPTIYQIDTSDGSVVHSIAEPAVGSMGLTYDGANLWSTSPYSSNIVKMDPVSGDILASISTPSSSPMGLAWDGSYLWTADYTAGSNTLFQIDPDDGSVMNSIDLSISGNIHDLEWGGGFLWLGVTSGSSSTLYKMEISGLSVVPEPISSMLFLTGGATLAARRYFRKTNS